MRVKRFVGRNMQEAVGKMKSEFGEEAVILHTKKSKAPGLLASIFPARVEVIAALEDKTGPANSGLSRPVSPQARPPLSVKGRPAKKAGDSIREQGYSPEETQVLGAVGVGTGGHQELFSRVDLSELPEQFRRIARTLKAVDVEERLAVALVRSVSAQLQGRQHDPEQVHRLLRQRIANIFRVEKPWDFASGPEVVALVGPTGVGKTTTIAKLAANYALLSGKRVGLVTMDTYRIAAVDQLRTYAEIVDIPMAVVFTPDELQKAVEDQLRGCDLVLVDTAGRSQRNTAELTELQSFFQDGPVTQTHLVLSATTRYQDLVDIVSRFSVLSPTHLIFTKLDETSAYGALLNAYALAKKPLSYLTDGQSVPENIEAADAGQIADLILGRAKL